MKEERQHTLQELPPLQLKPIISYPRIAEAGEQYLLTIDVQLADGSPWPYQEEEFEISFILETAPFFTHEPLGEQEPGIVLHRFGGTYGAAEYLLTASPQPIAPGSIKIALLNGWGLPIAQLKLDCEVQHGVQAYKKQRAVIEQKKTVNAAKSLPLSFTPFPRGFSKAITREIHEKQLKAGGWGKQSVSDIPLKMSLQNGRQVTYRYTLLRLAPSLPVALLYKAGIGETLTTTRNHVTNAAIRLAVPFAYILIEGGMIEYDYMNNTFPRITICEELPRPASLQQRWLTSLRLTDAQAIDALTYPYQTNQIPRYYQEAAINQGMIETLRALRGLRNRRILLTLATGTGKTLIAFQIIWKLKRTRQVGNVLFLADRSYLLDQAQFNTFGPFQDAIIRGTGQIDTAHDIVFATYQWLASIQDGKIRYGDYPPDYFDVIVVDECHRSSAGENSEWRRVLEYFSHAVQIGFTATPLDTRDVQTSRYYGPSVYTYSLSQGIQDNYLAPYRVHRVLIEQSLSTSETEPDAGLYLRELLANSQAALTIDQNIVIQAGNLTQLYTQTIAQHLASYLQRTNIHAKTIVFCVDNAHADRMRVELEKACAAWIKVGDIVRIVDDDGTEGRRALNLFCAPRESQPVIVTTSRLLTTGVDVPTCKNIVLARGVGSLVEFKQIIGRGTRLFPPEKTWFTIIDYAGAIKHFFDPDFDGPPQLVESETIAPFGETRYFTETSSHDTSRETQDLLSSVRETSIDVEYQLETYKPDNFIRETTDSSRSTNTESGTETDADLISRHYAARKPNILLRAERIQRGWTLQDVAERIGLPDPNTIGRWERGVSFPRSHYRHELSRIFGKSLDELGLLRKNGPSSQIETPKTDTIHIISKEENGNQFAVIHEEIYELAPDGRTLRKVSNNEFSQLKLQDIAETPQELKERWIIKEDRQEIIAGREDLLKNLLDALELKNVDAFDFLLYMLFHIPMITRSSRVGRLRAEHTDFFQRFENNALANQVLNMILDKYVNGDIVDVNDVALLRIPPLSTLGTPMELAQAFREEPVAEQPNAQATLSKNLPKNSIGAVLKELQSLLYQVW